MLIAMPVILLGLALALDVLGAASGLGASGQWSRIGAGVAFALAAAGTFGLALVLTQHPAVVLPNGFSKDGLPTSITFTGQLFGEGKLLQVAEVYQRATEFNKKHPKMNF